MALRYSRNEKGLNTKEIIENARTKIFDFDYPFWDNDYKGVFETNFIRRFYFVEVGYESTERFLFELETWLQLNMGYYVKMWESEQFEYDPLTNYDLTTEHDQNNTLNQNDERKGNQNSSLNQDTKRTADENDKRNLTSSDSRNQQSTDTRNQQENDSRNQETDDTRNLSTNELTDELENSTTNNDTSTNNFERDLNSSQPAKRLQLTTNEDGTGVIEYADSIEEKKNTSNENGNSETNGNRSNERDLNSDEIGNRKSTESGNRELDELGSSETDETGKRESEETGNRSQNENEEQKASSLTSNSDDLKRNITNVENFIERKYGSAGVKTYPELIEDYRNSLLRLELMIFNEMRKELFMKIF